MSKRYDVYGIGNALVDVEYEVTTEFLRSHSIEKGVMTLVSEDRIDEIVNVAKGVTFKRSCGGSAANTMIGIAQMGGQAFYSCKVANDETGQFFYEDLKRNGLLTNLSEKGRPSGVTGRCVVFITPDADRTMSTHLGITQSFSESELVESALADSKYLYMEGYLVASPSGKSAAIKAREVAERAGVKTAITFSDPNMVSLFKTGFMQMIGDRVDLVFCNEAEAYAMTGKNDIRAAGVELKKLARSFAITLGARGAYLFDGKKEIEVVAPKVKAISTNGAGDLFAGAFLYAISNGADYLTAGKLACAAASELVTKIGARLTIDEAKKIRKEIVG